MLLSRCVLVLGYPAQEKSHPEPCVSVERFFISSFFKKIFVLSCFPTYNQDTSSLPLLSCCSQDVNIPAEGEVEDQNEEMLCFHKIAIKEAVG